jgi:hypothetical protein
MELSANIVDGCRFKESLAFHLKELVFKLRFTQEGRSFEKARTHK